MMTPTTSPPVGREGPPGGRIDLFSGCGPAEMEEITAASRVLRKERGEFVYMPGEPADSVYVLRKGRIKLSMLAESAREFVIDIIQAGEIFGEFALIDESERSNMAQALDDAVMWMFGKRDFMRVLAKQAALNLNYIRLVGDRRRRMEKKLSDLTAKDVWARVCELLHDYSTSAAAVSATRDLVVPLTHQDVANLIGTSRQTTTTFLNVLERQGVIELGRGWIRVKRLEHLQQLCQ